MQTFALSLFASLQSSRSAHINTHTFLPLFPQLFTTKLFKPLACQPVKMASQPSSQSHGLARRRKPQASWSSPRLPSSAPLETFGHAWIFESFMAYWAEAFWKGVGRKPLSHTGFRNLLLDNPASTDQCLVYKRQMLLLKLRKRTWLSRAWQIMSVIRDLMQFCPSQYAEHGPSKMLYSRADQFNNHNKWFRINAFSYWIFEKKI